MAPLIDHNIIRLIILRYDTFENMFRCFDTVPACDGRTDGQIHETDRHLATGQSSLLARSKVIDPMHYH